MLASSQLHQDQLLTAVKPVVKAKAPAVSSNAPASQPNAAGESKQFSSELNKANGANAAVDDNAGTQDEPGEENIGNNSSAGGDRLPDGADLILELSFDLDAASRVTEGDEALIIASQLVLESVPKQSVEPDIDLELRASTPTKIDLLGRVEKSINALKANVEQSLNIEGLGSDRARLTVGNVANVEAEVQTLNLDKAPEIKPINVARVELVVPMRLGAGDWGDSVAGKISLMINQRITSAKILITPPELGPIEVRVNLNNDQASVQFISHSAQVRDALEDSIPRLRELLEAGGFSLADSDVSDQSKDDGTQQEQHSESDDQFGGEAENAVRHNIGVGLIDHYV
ncbi:MAG: flagellar hook-length control protein FliK [Pseudomonadales bacterium]|nr:flagellar hook-length control protein FliK [Pseudomonadales bacterium]